jgi:hypothetical protein
LNKGRIEFKCTLPSKRKERKTITNQTQNQQTDRNNKDQG